MRNGAIEKLGNRTLQTISGGTETHYFYGSGANRLVRRDDVKNGGAVEHDLVSYDSGFSGSERDK